MKIFQINAKMGVLPEEAKKNLTVVLERMKAGREYSQSRFNFSDSRIVRCELPEQEAMLVNDEFIPSGKTEILTKNREYTIDNESGEVTLLTNPLKYLFISGKKALRNVSNIIETTKTNFDNSEKVKQCRLIIEGFTKEGADRLQQAIERVQAKNKQ